jgi:UDP-GlcNAc:undecaprenyl-phosphate GlcNAc-1-phosphate transferase
MRSYLIAFLLSLVASALLTPVAMRLGRRLGALDRTNGAPIPRSGGLAIAPGTVLAVGVFALVFLPTRGLLRLSWIQLDSIYAGAAVILVLGVVDDIVRLKAPVKLAVETLVAIVL